MLVATNRKRRVEKLVWPKRPRLSRHRSLGRRQTWIEAAGVYRVERFPDIHLKKPFSAISAIAGQEVILSHHRLLAAAMRACFNDAKRKANQ